jgi:hypothetical protein
MNDQQLDQLIETARRSYRVPPEPSLDELWTGIASRRGRPSRRPWAARAVRIMGIAAAVVVAFSLGRYSTTPSAPGGGALAASPTPSIDRPIEETTTLLLGQSVVLLSTLPITESSPAGDLRFSAQARDMLATTRLLLDSRASANPKLRELLEDLEFVLAQIARLQNSRSREELELITDALQQQDIVPRIRSIAAGLGAGDD